jgi:predicted dehydrogenase
MEISLDNNDEKFPLPVIEESDQFVQVIDHMAECILKNKEPKTPGEEGLKDQYVIDAIYRSARQKKVVYLKEITEHCLLQEEQFQPKSSSL